MPQKLHGRDISTNTNVQIDRSIVLRVLRGASHELFCVFGDFYTSGTQNAEVTKSLFANNFFQNAGNKQRELMICGEVFTTICFGEKKISFIHQFQAGF